MSDDIELGWWQYPLLGIACTLGLTVLLAPAKLLLLGMEGKLSTMSTSDWLSPLLFLIVAGAVLGLLVRLTRLAWIPSKTTRDGLRGAILMAAFFLMALAWTDELGHINHSGVMAISISVIVGALLGIHLGEE